MAGKLYLIGTPIGNLGDVTRRAAEVLASLDALYCEDTRVTSKLLAHLGISLPLRALSDDHSDQRWAEPVQLALQGKRVGFVTDAGMPGASDPGRRLCRAAWEAGVTPAVIPGPSSVSTLLAACPFIDSSFLFVGFAPRKAGERRDFCARIAAADDPCLFFESPLRVHALLGELCAVLEPERQLLIGREMTKLHEQFVLFFAGEWAEITERVPALGEFTVAVAARPEPVKLHGSEEALAALQRLTGAGFSKRDAVKALAAVWEMPANELKKLSYGDG